MRFSPRAGNGARGADGHAVLASGAFLRNDTILDQVPAHGSGAIFVGHMCQVFGTEIAEAW